MPDQAETSSFDIISRAETNWGETPSEGTWKILRITGESIEPNADTEVSKEIQAHAQDTDVVRTGLSVAGDLNFDFTWGTWDEYFEGLLRKTAVSGTYTAATIAAASGDNSINDSATSFPATIVAGMWIKIAGFTGTVGNNGTAEVVSATTGKIVIKSATNCGITLVTDAEGESVTITFKMIRCGTTKKSFVVEKRFADVTLNQYFNGLRVEGFSLSIPAKGLVTGNFKVNGKQSGAPGATVVGGGSVTAVDTNEVFSASGNVVFMREGTTSLTTIVKEVKIDVTNNTRMKDRIMSLYPANIGYGKFGITGTIQAYFEDATLLNKFLNDTESALVIKLQDDNGKIVIFSFPRVKYLKGSVLAEGENSDIFVNLNFRAFRDATLLTSMQIDIM